MIDTTTIRHRLRTGTWKLIGLSTGILYLTTAAAVGFREAWDATSLSEVVPTEIYLDAINPETGTLLGDALVRLFVLPLVALSEAVGLVAYEYLFWVPQPVVVTILNGVVLSVMAVVAINAIDAGIQIREDMRGESQE